MAISHSQFWHTVWRCDQMPPSEFEELVTDFHWSFGSVDGRTWVVLTNFSELWVAAHYKAGWLPHPRWPDNAVCPLITIPKLSDLSYFEFVDSFWQFSMFCVQSFNKICNTVARNYFNIFTFANISSFLGFFIFIFTPPSYHPLDKRWVPPCHLGWDVGTFPPPQLKSR